MSPKFFGGRLKYSRSNTLARLYKLEGLTCTEERVPIRNAQRFAKRIYNTIILEEGREVNNRGIHLEMGTETMLCVDEKRM